MIIILLVLILIAIIIWCRYYTHGSITHNNTDINDEVVPTLHAKCNEGLGCGGELVCDIGSHRCRQRQGGSCSDNVDCMAGLYCNNWVCSNDDNHDTNSIDNRHDKKNNNHIKWVDNQTFYYNISA